MHRVVVTHHVPSYQLVAPEFRGSRINGAFTVELADYIAVSGIDYWIYGHSHRNIDKTIGSTRCLCNQFGYVSHNEHLTFDRGKVIELLSRNVSWCYGVLQMKSYSYYQQAG